MRSSVVAGVVDREGETIKVDIGGGRVRLGGGVVRKLEVVIGGFEAMYVVEEPEEATSG